MNNKLSKPGHLVNYIASAVVVFFLIVVMVLIVFLVGMLQGYKGVKAVTPAPEATLTMSATSAPAPAATATPVPPLDPAQTENLVTVRYTLNNNGNWLRTISVQVTGCDISIRFNRDVIAEQDNPNGSCGYFELNLFSLQDELLEPESDWYAQSLQANGIQRIVIVDLKIDIPQNKLYLPIVVR